MCASLLWRNVLGVSGVGWGGVWGLGFDIFLRVRIF